MQEHLAPLLDGRAGLNAERRALVQEYYDAAPQLFQHDAYDLKEIMTRPGGFVERGKKAFGDSLSREVLLTVAPSPAPVVARYHQAGLFAGIDQAINSGLRAIFPPPDDCNCTIGVACPINFHCISGPGTCNEKWCWIIYSCDGLCSWSS